MIRPLVAPITPWISHLHRDGMGAFSMMMMTTTSPNCECCGYCGYCDDDDDHHDHGDHGSTTHEPPIRGDDDESTGLSQLVGLIAVA